MRRTLVRVAGLLILMGLASLPARAGAKPPYPWPLEAPTHITSTFGEYRPGHLHDGIDLSTGRQTGRKVRAVDTGLVERVFYDPAKYGKTVVIRHADGTRSWYSHLDRLGGMLRDRFRDSLEPFTSRTVQRRIPVSRGDVIARTGETGSGINHLHFSLQRPDGTFVNPLGHFDPEIPFDPRPHIQSVRLFPLDGRTWLEGGARPLQLSEPQAGPLNLWGTVGLDVTLWNRHPGSTARTLPRTIRILRDGKLVLERRFETIPDTSPGRFRSLYNERLSNLGPTQFTLHATPVGQQSTWQGFEFTSPGDSGTLTVELRTSTGQVTRRTIPYRSRRPAFVGLQGEPNPSGSVSRSLSNYTTSTLQRASLERDSKGSPAESTSSPRLVTGWIQNRLRIDLRVPAEASPELTVRQEEYSTGIPLIQRGPGHYVSWWTPALNRDGWHRLQATYRRSNEDRSLTHRVYVQSMRVNKPGVIVSLDGRYSLFNSGPGLKFSSFVQIQPSRQPVPSSDELSLVEPPRRIRPRTLSSSRSLELTVNLPEGIQSTDRVGLYVLNPVTERWEVLSYREGLTASSRQARVTAGRLVALMVDRRAPRIKPPRYNAASRRVLIPVAENGSGLVSSDIRITEEGSPVNFLWNFDRNQVEIPVTGDRNELDLAVRIRDRAGNANQWEGRVETGP